MVKVTQINGQWEVRVNGVVFGVYPEQARAEQTARTLNDPGRLWN